MMNCNDINKNLVQYVTGNISDHDAISFKQHLSDCPVCSEQYQMLLKTWETLSEIPQCHQPSDISAGVLARIEEYENRAFTNRIRSWFKTFNLNFATTYVAALFAGLVIGTVFESLSLEYPGSQAVENEIYSEFFYDISPFSIAGGYSEMINETEGE